MSKVWLNDLKKGDTFYYILESNLDSLYDNADDCVLKCEIIGKANDKNFLMPRVSFKACDKELVLTDFVNKYVYTNEESAKEYLKEKINEKIANNESKLLEHKATVSFLQGIIAKLKKEKETL